MNSSLLPSVEEAGKPRQDSVHLTSPVPSEGLLSAPTKTAVLVRDDLAGYSGRASLYRLSPPLSDRDWSDDKEIPAYEYVVASATHCLGRPETYLFGADSDGEIVNWMELPGSMKDTLDHAVALANAGYTIVEATGAQS